MTSVMGGELVDGPGGAVADEHSAPALSRVTRGGRAELPPPLPLPADAVHADGPVPPSQPAGFGSGPENPTGLRMTHVRSGDVVWTTLTLGERFAGRPGKAHGGALAAAVDDLLGAVLRVLGRHSVTAQLDVTYLVPVLIGQELTVEGWVVAIEGRKVRAVARITADGRVAVVARGLFVDVDVDSRAMGDVPGR